MVWGHTPQKLFVNLDVLKLILVISRTLLSQEQYLYLVTGSHDPVTGSHDPVTGSHDPVIGSHDPVTGSHDPVTGSSDIHSTTFMKFIATSVFSCRIANSWRARKLASY